MERKLTIPKELANLSLVQQVEVILQEVVQLRQVVTELSHALTCQQAMLTLFWKERQSSVSEAGNWIPITQAGSLAGMPSYSALRKWIAAGKLIPYDPRQPERHCHYRHLGKNRKVYINVKALLTDMETIPNFPHDAIRSTPAGKQKNVVN
jgi:hypothetical protein